MSKLLKPDWESFQSNQCIETYRLKVYGGWLVRTCWFDETGNGTSRSEALVFVPDPEHKWTPVEVQLK